MRSAKRFGLVSLFAILASVLATALFAGSQSDASDAAVIRQLDLKLDRRRATEQYRNQTNRAWASRRAMEASARDYSPGDGATPQIPAIRNPRQVPAASGAASPPPAPSPGQDIGFTAWDAQAISSQAPGVARIGGADGTDDNVIHFTWMAFDFIPTGIYDPFRVVHYARYTDPENYPTMSFGSGYNGIHITGEHNRGGYSNVDVNGTNRAQVGFHQAEDDIAFDPQQPWHAEFPFLDETYQVFPQSGYDNSCPVVLLPRLTADRSSEVVHEIAHSFNDICPDHKLWYWRYNPVGFSWDGPGFISNTEDLSYALAVDAQSNKVAVVVHGNDAGPTNVYYIESAMNGTDWLPSSSPLPKTAITNYTDPVGPQAWLHLAATYDNSTPGVLHVMWDEQRIDGSEHVALMHWNSTRNTSRIATLGYWDNPVSPGIYNLNLAKLSIGIGDGSTLCQGGAQSNDNYVYCLYTQFGGRTLSELNDHSSAGYMNGELYLISSNTAGNTWSPPLNLTSTKTPGCDPGLADPQTGDPANPDDVCRSENWATIGRVIRDIDISFVSDLDAGAANDGEGTWQLNPLHYLQLAGGLTNAQYVCPVIAPVFESILEVDPECEYHAMTNSQLDIELKVMNLGNATLTQGGGGGIFVSSQFAGGATLSIVGGNTPVYSIPAGGADIVKTVHMQSTGSEGLYVGAISITHNDANPSNPSPRVYPIEFFVFDEFFCSEELRLKTGVASPGSLQLAIESSGRFGSDDPEGGLWRHSDSSSSIRDASLLLAYGTQSPGDTTVFMRFMDRASNGQNGFRSQSELMVDTLDYSSGSGWAMAGAYTSTKDSVVGVNMSWYFPQSPGLDEVVIVNYLIFPGPKYVGGTINDVTSGLIVDLDQLPAQRNPLDTAQVGSNNSAFVNSLLNLAFVRGLNKPGYIPSGPNTTERFRSGMAAVTGCEGIEFLGFDVDLAPKNGPSDQHLYNALQNVSGFGISASDTNVYAIAGFDRGMTLAPVTPLTYRKTTVLSHTVVFAADTISEASFYSTVNDGASIVNAGLLPYTANAGVADGCAICPCRFDPECDGVTDIFDVIHVVCGAFRGVVTDPAITGGFVNSTPMPTQAGCNFDSRDVDANHIIDVLDVTKTVAVALRSVNFRTATTFNPSFVDPCTRFKEWTPSTITQNSSATIASEEEDQGQSYGLGKFKYVAQPASANATFLNSVDVESKTVSPNASGVTAGVYISNALGISALVMPLEFREITPGSYITGAFSRMMNPVGRLWNSPLGGANPSGPNAGTTQFRYPTPGGNCSAPGRSYQVSAANVDFISPDGTMLETHSLGDPGIGDDIDLDPGSDPPGVPSYVFTFNVTGVNGSFRIDTCCVPPANHLLFVGAGNGNYCDPVPIIPTFTPGIITIGTPVICATNSSGDPFLVACPKGDVPFTMQLLDGAGEPIVGYSDVSLDFSACTGSELLPIAGQHPNWPIVLPTDPSDANGFVTFNVFAGGDCADCNVTVNTGCGFTTTVPVHSLDVNGDLCVDYTDHDPAEGLCRDYNADGIVDGLDVDLHVAHLDDCGPTGPCDYLSIQATIHPDGQVAQGDTIIVDWSVSNSGNPTSCDLDSVAFYHYDCDNLGTLVWVASAAVGMPIPPVGSLSGTVQYENPDAVDFCLQVRAYSNCCVTYSEKTIRVAIRRQCSPGPNCFSFYMTHHPGAYGIPDPASLLSQGWTFTVSEETVDNILRTKSTICVGPNAISGTEAGYRIFGANGFIKAYRISLAPLSGDICGIVQDCNGNPNQGGPDCILDVIDVICLINYIFRNGASPSPCPESNADINCDGIPDVLDVVTEVNTIFRNATPPEPCP